MAQESEVSNPFSDPEERRVIFAALDSFRYVHRRRGFQQPLLFYLILWRLFHMYIVFPLIYIISDYNLGSFISPIKIRAKKFALPSNIHIQLIQPISQNGPLQRDAPPPSELLRPSHCTMANARRATFQPSLEF